MTAKQIRYFGTKRQRAALRSKRAGSHGGKKRSHEHRENGPIVGFTLANKGTRKRGKSKMATTKKRRAGKANHGYSHSKRNKKRQTNAGHRPRTRPNRGRARRRNAGEFGASSIGNIITNAIFVIAGALGSKLLTQMVLGSNNVGMIGYAGNAVVGAIMWFVTEKGLKNRTASNGVIAGTAVQIILRLINDYTPFGQYVSQLGMGDYQAQAFVTPQVLVDPYNSAQIRIPGAWLPPPPPAAPPKTVTAASAASGVSGYGGGNLYGGQSGLY